MSCAECGASKSVPSCDELFHRLLALDHSRQAPWGPLHAAAVACFFLQHPSRVQRSNLPMQWAMVHTYLRGGAPALAAVTRCLRRQNSHQARHGTAEMYDAPPLPQVESPKEFHTTIADVAADGTFPAAGYEERLRSWAADTIRAYAETAFPMPDGSHDSRLA